MLIRPDIRTETERLAAKLAGASSASAPFIAEFISSRPRLMTLKAMGKTGRLDRLVACGAWTEAAMELIALDAPTWSVQRICRDEGEWLCTLTRFPEIPDWLDEGAEGRHPVLVLAILIALLDARERTAIVSRAADLQLADASADCADYR